MRTATKGEYLKGIVGQKDYGSISRVVMYFRSYGYTYNDIAWFFEQVGINREQFEELMQVCDEHDSY